LTVVLSGQLVSGGKPAEELLIYLRFIFQADDVIEAPGRELLAFLDAGMVD
jgi:hypothetical protein